jgi:dihydrofolate reductase
VISLIYARSLDNCIGDKGQIPWHLPDEFSHFEQTTRGKPIIMGRKTYEDHQSALPGRLNIVISSQPDYRVAEGVHLTSSLQEAIALGRESCDEIFVIGGVTFFTAALPNATTVYETIVETRIAGDTVLPNFDFSAWQTACLQEHPTDAQHVFAYTVYRHRRERLFKIPANGEPDRAL